MTQHWPDDLCCDENSPDDRFTPSAGCEAQNAAESRDLPPHIAAAVQASIQSARRMRDWMSAIFDDQAPTTITYRRWLPGEQTPDCDCPLDPHHRWNCRMTPIWAQTIRDLDTNPWTVIQSQDLLETP